MRKRERLSVVANEAVGLYTLIRVERGSLEPGIPGQFFMVEAPGRLLPRPMSLCTAPPGELGFLLDAIGPGTTAICEVEPGDTLHVFGPLGNGYRLDVERPLLVGGGIGIAPLPYLSEALGSPPALLGFRSDAHAVAAGLVPNAEIVVEPTYVTEPLRERLDHDVLACGPEPMLEAVAHVAAKHGRPSQVSVERVMGCGLGGCYSCVVRVRRDGQPHFVRACLDGPVFDSDRLVWET